MLQEKFHSEPRRSEDTFVSPLVSIFETEKEVVLKAEMPGLSKDHIDLEVRDDELQVIGRRAEEKIPEGYTEVYRERYPYDYKRSFVLGSEINQEKIAAGYENGVLTVAFEKAAHAQPKRISIN